MEGLLKVLFELEEYNRVLNFINNKKLPLMISGIFESQKAHVASGILKELDRPSIFVVSNEVSAKKIFNDMRSFLGDRVLFYPTKELVLYDVEAQGHDIALERLSAVKSMLNIDNFILIISTESLFAKVMPKEKFLEYSKVIKKEQRYNINELMLFFTNCGYQHSHMVEGKGQFSVRGEIIDIFPIDQDNPFRIDFFDDVVETIKEFDITSQRSISEVNEIFIFPARELIVNDSDLTQGINNIQNDLNELIGNNIYSKLEKKVLNHIDKMRQKIFFPMIENYTGYFYPDSSLFSYLPQNGLVVIDEFSKVEQAGEAFYEHVSGTFKDASDKGNIMLKNIKSFFSVDELLINIPNNKCIYLNTFLQGAHKTNSNIINISSRPAPSFNGKIDLLIKDIKEWQNEKKRIIILAGSAARANILLSGLKEEGISCYYKEDIDRLVKKGEVILINGSLERGFEYTSLDLVVVSDREMLGSEKKKRKHKKILGQKIKVFSDLNHGDYVVHEIHGIGEYIGIEKLKVEGITKDYFKIQYIKGHLYVPINQLDLIQKYIGSEGKKPKINRLGGNEWSKLKTRVKESLEDIAKELINLYAARQMAKGYAFSEDNIWQRQFEETFPYEETSDQLRCIEETKTDMEKFFPMDRLLCGDVGYGKTEVAMRAAFKAVMSGKQVAYLVPTTILASQHYNNFIQRMRDFPVTVEMLSRFRTPTMQKKIVKQLKDGLIDIVIGTHRILQKDISFKDLGLVIVDEEQRFGVTHKEKLKMLKNNVDVLTLTATPIPRTLHMALVGVRDMSVIDEPPQDRHPVQTYVLEYNDDFVKDAIMREIGRGGQVFYLHNRISSISKVTSHLQSLVPEAKIVYAHGKNSESELENIIFDFIDKQYDILVCTTIIENGVDMANVNTIIIEDADKMGLSQLYQLRGRVGRGKNQAFAYFTFRKDKVLSEEAEKRLKAIKEFTEFGSGFKIAMRDLEIRGAGNLVGAEQHGHMNLVGYEMYCKLLEDTIKTLKGEKIREEVETTIDINISAYIDDSYIEDTNQKIEMYKKIASIQNEEDVLEIKAEFLDRFGEIPEETDNLINIAYIKSLCIQNNIFNVSQKNKDIMFTYSSFNNDTIKRIGELSNIFKKRVLFTASQNPYVTFKTEGIGQKELLRNIKILLQNLKN